MEHNIDEKTLWDQTLQEIERFVSAANFSMWFKDTFITKIDDGVVFIGVPNIFVKDWLANKFHKDILRILRTISPEVRSAEYIVAKIDRTKQNTPQPQKPHQNNELPLSDHYITREDNLNPRYTFDTFIVGPFNELAFAAAQAIIKQPGIVYNPLFLYGGTGHGKTHLIQAIGNHIKTSDPEKRVYYVTSERFATDIINSIQTGKIKQVKDKYRKYDILIMDDIQFLSNKEKSQEELFHLFNFLYDNNKQIVFSSDKHPNLIPKLEERLMSRFNQGMIVDIPKPDIESRGAIIKAKASNLSLPISDEVITYIATEVEGNIREIEGVMNLLSCQSQLKKREVNLNDVRALLKTNSRPKRTISIEDLVRVVAEFYNIERDSIVNKSRRKEIVRPRQLTMYILREYYDVSYPTIGEKLGGTTVIHSYEKIKGDLKKDSILARDLEQIRSML